MSTKQCNKFYRSSVSKYFKKSETEKNVLLCQVAKDEVICGMKLSDKTSNLKRHLERQHPEIFKIIEEENQTKATVTGQKTFIQPSISRFAISEKVTISMTAEKLKSQIIQMVVNDGVPLTFFSAQGFSGLNGELAKKLGISMERHDVRKLVISEAEKQKKKTETNAPWQIFYFKMDACTRQRINYFALNVQFTNSNNEITIRTLAVRETQAQHTSQFIKNLVEEVLKEFELTKDQVLAIVTDNASNMVSAIDKLNVDPCETDNTNLDCESEICIVDTENCEVSLETETELNEDVDSAFTAVKIEHMRCAVHTLQLAIRDGLKGQHAHNLIANVRQMAVTARTPKVEAILRRKGGKTAILDQVTRWGSTYLMIKRLLELKNTLIDMAHPDITMTDFQWGELERLEAILRHPFLVTKKLQAAELTPGSFYKEWQKLILTFSQIGGKIADAVKESMEKREKVLLNNDVLLAAIYVDPMYRITLSDVQLSRGKLALSNIAIQMEQYKYNYNTSNLSSKVVSEHSETQKESETEKGQALEVNVNEPSTSSTLNFDDEAAYEEFLDLQAKRRRTEGKIENRRESPIAKLKLDITHALSEMEKIDRSSKLNVLKAVPHYPKLIQDVAYTVTSMPTTQVSVERLFSALRIIRSDLRASMKEDLLEAILFLRTNTF